MACRLHSSEVGLYPPAAPETEGTGTARPSDSSGDRVVRIVATVTSTAPPASAADWRTATEMTRY